MPSILVVVGFGGIVLGIVALLSNIRMARRSVSPRFWFPLFASSVIVGMLIGPASLEIACWLGYGVEEPDRVGRVVGIPFMAAYFDSDGFDYVGPITLLAVIANVVFWFLAPQLPVWIYGLLGRKRVPDSVA